MEEIRVKDIDYDESGVLGANSECSLQQATKPTADSIALASSEAITKELQRRVADRKPSNKNKLFDPGGVLLVYFLPSL